MTNKLDNINSLTHTGWVQCNSYAPSKLRVGDRQLKLTELLESYLSVIRMGLGRFSPERPIGNIEGEETAMQSVLEPPALDLELIARVESFDLAPTPALPTEDLVEAQARLRYAIDAEALTSLKAAAAILRRAGWPHFDHYAVYTRAQLTQVIAGAERIIQAVEGATVLMAKVREMTPNPALRELSRELEKNLNALSDYAKRVRTAAIIKPLLQDLRTVIPAQSAADLPDLLYTFPIHTARTVLAEEGFSWPDSAILDYDEETGWASVRFELDVSPEAAAELDAKIDTRMLRNGLKSVPLSIGVYGTAVSLDLGGAS